MPQPMHVGAWGGEEEEGEERRRIFRILNARGAILNAMGPTRCRVKLACEERRIFRILNARGDIYRHETNTLSCKQEEERL